MTDKLDALWPEWMVQKRDEIKAERVVPADARKAADAEVRDAHVDCSMAEIERQRRQDAARRSKEHNDADAFYRAQRFRKQPEQSGP